MIESILKNKQSSEKALIKSEEIAKQKMAGVYNDSKYRLKIEIIGDVKTIEIEGQWGIELFAKAWKNGKQLGFGKDGSVEIERFRIFNPPILVDDPNGTIVRTWTDTITGELKQRKLREDPIEAIRQDLAHTISLVRKENTQIVIGKIGNTTSTFYPNADVESTSVDGSSSYNDGTNPGTVWATMRDAATGTGVNDATSPDTIFTRTTFVEWRNIGRAFLLFDTSTIGSDTIDSATISVNPDEVFNVNTTASWTKTVVLVASTPASNTAITTADYDQFGTTQLSDSSYDTSTLGVGSYASLTLNATGRAAVNGSGISKFGLRTGNDNANSEPTDSDGTDRYEGMSIKSAETAGTTADPKLVVVHSAVSSGKNFLMFM